MYKFIFIFIIVCRRGNTEVAQSGFAGIYTAGNDRLKDAFCDYFNFQYGDTLTTGFYNSRHYSLNEHSNHNSVSILLLTIHLQGFRVNIVFIFTGRPGVLPLGANGNIPTFQWNCNGIFRPVTHVAKCLESGKNTAVYGVESVLSVLSQPEVMSALTPLSVMSDVFSAVEVGASQRVASAHHPLCGRLAIRSKYFRTFSTMRQQFFGG